MQNHSSVAIEAHLKSHQEYSHTIDKARTMHQNEVSSTTIANQTIWPSFNLSSTIKLTVNCLLANRAMFMQINLNIVL